MDSREVRLRQAPGDSSYSNSRSTGTIRAAQQVMVHKKPYPLSNIARCRQIKLTPLAQKEALVVQRFKVGDLVSWNSEAGRVSGAIIRIHTQNVDYKGHTHHASSTSPQYEIKSSKTDHVALHRGEALTRLSD